MNYKVGDVVKLTRSFMRENDPELSWVRGEVLEIKPDITGMDFGFSQVTFNRTRVAVRWFNGHKELICDHMLHEWVELDLIGTLRRRRQDEV